MLSPGRQFLEGPLGSPQPRAATVTLPERKRDLGSAFEASVGTGCPSSWPGGLSGECIFDFLFL